jgi:hypothetical protein
MTWPQATDYNAAVQNPQLCFCDDELRQGQVVGDVFGLPRPHSGNFADVYQIQGAEGQGWAIKCFTRPVAGLRPRYQAISEHLRQTQRAFMVEFHFLDEGICIGGQWHPLVKMRWVEGFRLNEFVREQLAKPMVLERLAQLWVRLARELRDAQMAHGDLQHGNVLLVPGSKSDSLALKLIDYDGMYVPSLADRPSGEVGHANYQHPRRLREGGYDREMDRFAHLLIYTALRCLRIGGAELWQRYDNGENLLFREEDFRQPSKSNLLRELWDLKDRDARDLVGHLLLASQGPLLVVPALDELLEESAVRPLTGSEEAQVNALLGASAARAPRTRPMSPVKKAPATVEMPAVAIPPVPTSVLVEEPDAESAIETAAHAASLETTPSLPRLTRRGSTDLIRETNAPAKDTRELTRFLEPVVSILSRPGWLAVLGAIALLSFLVVNVLVWATLKKPSGAETTVRRPHLQPIDDVIIPGGHKHEIALAVERNECAEPLEVRVAGLPADVKTLVKTPALTLGSDQETAVLPLLAPLDVELPPSAVFVSLWQGGEKIEEQHFRLSVRKTPQPTLHQPEDVECRAGASCVFTARVERNGCSEPLALEFSGLPAGVRQEPQPPADADSPCVRLIVPVNAAPQKGIRVNLMLRAADAVADTKKLSLNIQEAPSAIDKAAMSPGRLKIDKMPDTLSVTIGEKTKLPISLARGDYRGVIEVRLEKLPKGVTATPVNVPAADSTAAVIVEATEEAQEGRTPVKVLAAPDGQQIDERTLTLSVEKAEPSSEEPVITDGRTKRVTFHTVDHARIVGTLYPGKRGKKGACVLMLHEMGRDRQVEAWRRLAEALQEEGHTVLTFDFRGHGDSKRVSRDFWGLQVNRNLPVYRRGKVGDEPPRTIEAGDFSPEYLPWMIHDIAAARMFLDRLHEDKNSSVNSSNLMIFGAGRGAALGSLWLASEAIRYDATGTGKKTKLTGLENRDILRADWLGIETKWKDHKFPVDKWVHWAHHMFSDSMVPMEFMYGEKDATAALLVGEVSGGKNGVPKPIPGARLAGMMLLEKDRMAEKLIRAYLVKVLKECNYHKWKPRKLESLHSYWGFPTPAGSIDFYLARRPEERLLHPVPLGGFGIRLEGMPQPRVVVPGAEE